MARENNYSKFISAIFKRNRKQYFYTNGPIQMGNQLHQAYFLLNYGMANYVEYGVGILVLCRNQSL